MTTLKVEIADYACVPAFGDIGKMIEIGQWANGDGFAPYEHVLGYAGYFLRTPEPGPRIGQPMPITGSGPGHYVIEAMPRGARLRKLEMRPEDYPGALWSTGKLGLTEQQRTAIFNAAWTLLGTPYSGLDYQALAAHRLKLHPLDYLLKARVASSGHLICSQYWDLAYSRGGYHLFTDNRWPGYVTPLSMAHRLNA
jgi:hypothetical protein